MKKLFLCIVLLASMYQMNASDAELEDGSTVRSDSSLGGRTPSPGAQGGGAVLGWGDEYPKMPSMKMPLRREGAGQPRVGQGQWWAEGRPRPDATQMPPGRESEDGDGQSRVGQGRWQAVGRPRPDGFIARMANKWGSIEDYGESGVAEEFAKLWGFAYDDGNDFCYANDVHGRTVRKFIKEQLSEVDVVADIMKPGMLTAALLYLQRAGGDIVSQLHHSIAKPKSALAQARVKRREQQIRQVVAALTALGIGGYSLSALSKRYYRPGRTLVKGLSSAGLAAVLGSIEVARARKKQKEAEKEITRLQAAQAV